VRALLDLIRENEEAVQTVSASCAAVLCYAQDHLTILDPEVGEKELIHAVNMRLASLRSQAGF